MKKVVVVALCTLALTVVIGCGKKDKEVSTKSGASQEWSEKEASTADQGSKTADTRAPEKKPAGKKVVPPAKTGVEVLSLVAGYNSNEEFEKCIAACDAAIATQKQIADMDAYIDGVHYFKVISFMQKKDFPAFFSECEKFMKAFPESKYIDGVKSSYKAYKEVEEKGMLDKM